MCVMRARFLTRPQLSPSGVSLGESMPHWESWRTNSSATCKDQQEPTSVVMCVMRARFLTRPQLSPSGVSLGQSMPHWEGWRERGPLTFLVFSNWEFTLKKNGNTKKEQEHICQVLPAWFRWFLTYSHIYWFVALIFVLFWNYTIKLVLHFKNFVRVTLPNLVIMPRAEM